MDNSQRYAELLTGVLQAAALREPNPQGLRIRSVCDREAGQFLIVVTGWARSEGKLAWHDYILVDVWLQGERVVVVENNVEDFLEDLIAAGIAAEQIVSIEELEEIERSVA